MNVKRWAALGRRADAIYDATCQKLYWEGWMPGDWDAYYEALDASRAFIVEEYKGRNVAQGKEGK